MKYLLDTNACIEHLRFGSASLVTNRMLNAPAGSVVSCTVVMAELLYGALRSDKPTQAVANVELFCSQLLILPFDAVAAREVADIRSSLARHGRPIGPTI